MAEGDLSVLVLIGMRGCGKTANGIAAAQALGRKFVDLDDVFEEEVGETINEFVDKYDWPAMREKEADILGRALTNQPLAGQRYGPHDPVVVACGGGVIETEANVAALTAFYGVIFVDRNIDDIVDYLEGAGSYRPGLGDHPATIFERRLPLYKQCCDYQFTIAKGETDFDAVNSDFERLTAFIVGQSDPAASVLADAPVLCLTHPGYAEWADGATRSALAAMSPEAGSGVVELRADLLSSTDEAYVHEQIALVRRHLPPHVPLRFVLRSVGQGGAFEGGEGDVFRVLQYALVAGVEIIDVELCWSDAPRAALGAACRNARLRPYRAAAPPARL